MANIITAVTIEALSAGDFVTLVRNPSNYNENVFIKGVVYPGVRWYTGFVKVNALPGDTVTAYFAPETNTYLAGLVTGDVYYADPANSGKVTNVFPTTAFIVQRIGVALSATELDQSTGEFLPGTLSSGGGSPTGPAGGDLSGTYPNPSVTWANSYPTLDLRYYPLSTNPAGYITSAALAPYLTSASAALTYLTIASAASTYLTYSTAATLYASLTGSYADPSWITSLAWSKITGAPAFITGITSSDVTTALGYTPATNARTISTTSPLTGGGDLSADRTLAINNAAADGSTKGAATFNANDFTDNGSGLISIDYTNGQSASASTKGFVTATDWTTFNNKISGKSFDLTTDQTAVTGTTANTLVASFNIPGNTVKVGDAWELKYRVRKTGVAGVLTITVYVNTSAAIGGTIIGIYQTTATALGIMMQRNVIIKTATNTEVMNTGTSNQAFDYLNSTVAYSALNIDWTVQQYLVFTIRNNSTADSSIMSFAEFKTTY